MTTPNGLNVRSRVCIVAPTPPPYGGMSIQASKLAVKLASEGLQTHVVSTNPKFPKPLRFFEQIPAVRTIVRELLYLYCLARSLSTTDVFHHFAVCGLSFFASTIPLILLARACDKRLIINYRGGRAPAFLKTWSGVAIPLMKLANSVIVPSEFLQRTFAQYGLETSVVSNLIDTQAFPYHSRTSMRPRLVVTRHLEPLYNIECLLRAFRILKDRYLDAELSIAGIGIEEQRLRKLCDEWGLSKVRFRGHVSAEDLPALYRENDIFVNASNADNFPAALVEAACSGLPIVTTSAGGIPDMIRDGQTGILVRLNDHVALADAVVKLVEDSDMAQRLAESARVWAEQFSWASTFASLVEHYGIKHFGAGQNLNTLLGHRP
jgi:phenylacetate-CoA ligase